MLDSSVESTVLWVKVPTEHIRKVEYHLCHKYEVTSTPLTVVKVDRRIRWHYTTTILRLRIGARLTRYQNCKFHNFARTISRHADGISRYSVPPSAGPLLPLTSYLHLMAIFCIKLHLMGYKLQVTHWYTEKYGSSAIPVILQMTVSLLNGSSVQKDCDVCLHSRLVAAGLLYAHNPSVSKHTEIHLIYIQEQKHRQTAWCRYKHTSWLHYKTPALQHYTSTGKKERR